MAEQIYGLIAKAMKMVGAIGKDAVAKDKSGKEQYKFRGIDAVYNALNPVMAELGLFVCPEILEQIREERTTQSGGVLKYSVLTIKYTMYAPDGSSISCTVVGEGMDSGDKASNKAMSVALKYAMFQLLMIPTEEMVDPDSEVHQDVLPKGKKPEPKQEVTTAKKVPQFTPKAEQTQLNPVLEYMSKERNNICAARGITKEENAAIWTAQIDALRKHGMIPDKKLSQYTMAEAEKMVGFMYTHFDQTGTVLKNVDGKAS